DGIRDGHVTGVQTCALPISFLTPEHLDVKMDFESVAQVGSMLGSGGVTVMEEGTCMVWAAENLLHFFYHESCGKCTPCREGTSRSEERRVGKEWRDECSGRE